MTKRASLHPEEPLDQALMAVARDILTRARDAICDPELSPDKAVHEFRKSMKRWRSFLRLIEPHFGDDARNLRQAARGAARELGGARDLRSTLDALEDICESAYELGDRAFKTIRDRIEDKKSAAETASITSADRAEIAGRISDWLAAISLWRFSGLQFSELSKSLTKSYRRARKAMPGDWQYASEEALHEFRKRAIDHRYQMELIEPIWPRMAKIWVDEAQRLREAIGAHRDLALLQKMAEPHQPLARFRSKLMPPIQRRQLEHLALTAKIASRVFAERPRAFHARIEALWFAGATED